MSAAEAETIVVELTPTSRAAVAVVLAAGPRAIEIVGQLFVPNTPWPSGGPEVGRILVGRWGSALGEELVVCRRGADSIEIHCHGGTAAVAAVTDALAGRGCHRLAWQEWLRRTARDPIVAAAQIALAEAPTARTSAILLDQFHGALSAQLESIGRAVETLHWPQAEWLVAELLGWQDLGLHLTSPWRVVLAGAPNVGKSSLMNALAGFERAIVSPQPGTTRDVVTMRTAIAGWPVQLADTAGLRTAANQLEATGVEYALTTLANADLVIVVRDAMAGTLEPDVEQRRLAAAVASLPATARTLAVLNKVDLLPARAAMSDAGAALMRTSAVTGEGVAELAATIADMLVPVVPEAGAAVPFTVAHARGLTALLRAILRRDTQLALKSLQALLAPGGE
jgi:tRNA modification GTPase